MIVLACGQWEHYTLQCLNSIVDWTEYPYVLYFVDNNSKDETARASAEWRKKQFVSPSSSAMLQCFSKRNPTDLGFPGGMNVGIEAAFNQPNCAAAICLNNDTVVTPGWLTRLMEVVDSREDVGVVGPMTNSCAGRQQAVPEPKFKKFPEDLLVYAAELAEKDDPPKETDFLSGYCFGITRGCYELLRATDQRGEQGMFDTIYGRGCFEDDDYGERVMLNEMKLLIVRNSFVCHFGNRTYKQEHTRVMESSKQKFVEKWGKEPRRK